MTSPANYCCWFPGCSYKTCSKSQIHVHHIVPREMGGKDDKWNKVWLCPTHHSHIYVPGSVSGIHSVKSSGSIIILGWRTTSGGRMLEYVDPEGEVKYHQADI